MEKNPFLIGGRGVRLKNGRFARASRAKAVFLLDAHWKEICEPRPSARVPLCAFPLDRIRYESFSAPRRSGKQAQQTAFGGLHFARCLSSVVLAKG